MKKYQIDWVQFAAAALIIVAMVVAFPLMCIISVAFVIALLLSRVAALVSVIIDEHAEARSRNGQK